MEFHYEVKVPKERIAVIVGVKGETKRKLEQKLDAKIKIDSEEGDIVITGEDSLKLHAAQNIIKAIGRGFNPKIALELADEGKALELIDIDDYTGDSKSRLVQIRARAIGTGGKTRRLVGELTNTDIVVYGKTVGIIGDYEGVKLARRAFESLLSGSRHTTIYDWLQKERKKRMVEMY